MRYAVVREFDKELPMVKKFAKWHLSEEDAKVEAMRLCRKEGVPFIVLRVIAICMPDNPSPPIRWEEEAIILPRSILNFNKKEKE